MREEIPERGAAVRVLPPNPARRRGRPAARRFTPAEVAELCAVPLERIQSVLDKAPLLFFPGAKQREGEWWIPESDVCRLVGGSITDPPALYSIKQFAKLMGWPLRTAYKRIDAGIVKTRTVLGVKCVPVSEYWNVPEQAMPEESASAARLSFFASKRTPKALEVAG